MPRGAASKSFDSRWVAGVYLLFAAWFAIRVGSGAAVLAGLAVVLTQMPRVFPGLTLLKSGEHILGVLVLVFVLCLTATECWVVALLVASSPEPTTMMVWQTAIFSGVPSLVVILLSIYAIRPGDDTWPTSALATLSILSLLAAVVLMDSRQPYQRTIERSLDEQLGRRAALPRAPVAWIGADLEPWALEGAPGWGSVPQGISVVFSRKLALLWRTRWDLLEVAGMRAPTRFEDAKDAWMPDIDRAAIQVLCQFDDGPGFVVVPTQSLHGVMADIRKLPTPRLIVPRKHGGRWARIDSVSRVDCAQFRRSRSAKISSRSATRVTSSER